MNAINQAILDQFEITLKCNHNLTPGYRRNIRTAARSITAYATKNNTMIHRSDILISDWLLDLQRTGSTRGSRKTYNSMVRNHYFVFLRRIAFDRDNAFGREVLEQYEEPEQYEEYEEPEQLQIQVQASTQTVPIAPLAPHNVVTKIITDQIIATVIGETAVAKVANSIVTITINDIIITIESNKLKDSILYEPNSTEQSELSDEESVSELEESVSELEESVSELEEFVPELESYEKQSEPEYLKQFLIFVCFLTYILILLNI